MLSMPKGTDPQIVLRAEREFAKAELSNHRYVMVLHTHQTHPHVHLSVRATASTFFPRSSAAACPWAT